MNLADQVIQANEDEIISEASVEVDDIGFPLPKPKTEKARCEYLTARIWSLHPYMYLHEGHLWIEDYMIPETKDSYYRLAKFPSSIKDHENQYVWTRLKELVPRLNTDIIAILPDLTFNMRTGELKHERVLTTTPWEERDDERG